MAIIIRTQGLSISPELKAHLLRRFTFALYRFENRISQTEVSVKDLNGGKAGLNKKVLVRIGLAGHETVVVEATAHDHFAAVGLAARRCKRAIRRALKDPLERRRAALPQLDAGHAGEPAAGFG